MARKDSKTSSSSKRKESPTKEQEDTKRSKTVDEQFEGKNAGNVVGGLKATLKNPNVSDEAKEHAEMMLDQVGADKNERVNRHGRDITHLMSDYKSRFDAPEEKDRDHARKVHSHLEQHHLRGAHLGHVIGGYKATLSNDNAGEEAKENAKRMLEELGAHENYEYKTKAGSEELNTEGKDIGHVIGGYKSTLSNPNVSDEAKEHAQKMLDQLEEHHKGGKHLGHVMAGYKATLSNSSNSSEAKDHARKVLKEMGAHEYDYSYTRDEQLNKHGKNLNNVIGGYKATLSNDKVSEEAKEHARKMLGQLEEHHTQGKNIGNVIGGYRATLSNPNVSEEARDHAVQMLEELGAEDYDYAHHKRSGHASFEGKNSGNVLGGYKATIHNPNASEEAKENARQILAENGEDESRKKQSGGDHADFDGKNTGNVLGGYKATIHNPNVSEEAKENARQILADNGEDENRKERSHGQGSADFEGKNAGNVIGGYKATLHNPNVSEEAKENARDILAKKGIDAQ